jgi:uncharacterized membrane protein
MDKKYLSNIRVAIQLMIDVNVFFMILLTIFQNNVLYFNPKNLISLKQKTKIKNNMFKDSFFTGLRTILPIVLFIIILGWVLGTLFDWIECIELLFPESMLKAIGLPDIVIKLLGLLLICVIVWIIGTISKQPRMSKKFKSWLDPIIYRIPLLSHLFKITNQVASSLRDTDSFKRVVLVKTLENGYEVGFITGEKPQAFCEALHESELISVVLPFSPLTSYRVLLLRPEDVVETDVPVATAISYIISMGSAGATNEIIKETPSV